MAGVMTTLRRNRKLFIGLLVVAALFYYKLWPRDPREGRTIARLKDTHPVSHFRRQVKTNDSLFNLILEQDYGHVSSKEAIKSYLRPEQYPPAKLSFQQHLLRVSNDFDFNNDVIVYLHIQKAGGTVLNQHLVRDVQLETPCRCAEDMLTNPCHCKNKHGNIWLFSWFTVGWPCELHADWTMLHECVDGALNEIESKARPRRYFYVTLLRDPVARYLSEWKHHRSGQHWKDGKLRCNGERVTMFDVRPCFNERTWEGVSLDDFMDCPENLATNRQTRMMADLTKSNCYHRDKKRSVDRSKLRLESAIENAGAMAFFGLTEYQKETKQMLEKAFSFKFNTEFQTLNEDDGDEWISDDEFIAIMKYIDLDIQFYSYAKELFLARTKTIS